MPVAPPIARSVTADSPPASSSCIAETRKRPLVDIIASPARRMRLSRLGRRRRLPKLGSKQRREPTPTRSCKGRLIITDLITHLPAPPNRASYCDSGVEDHLSEGAVMIAFAMHLLRNVSGLRHVARSAPGDGPRRRCRALGEARRG